MPLKIIHSNILSSKCQCIVNPTDGSYSGGGGTDFDIHVAAGTELEKECRSLPPLKQGEARYTSAHKIDCKYIIHTYGPMWFGGDNNEEIILRSCYLNCLILADKLKAESIAFPLISSGTFGFPKDQVMKIAMDAISDFLFASDSDISVVLCVFDKKLYEIREKPDLEDFLEEYLPKKKNIRLSSSLCLKEEFFGSAPLSSDICHEPTKKKNKTCDLDSWLKMHDDNFAITLLKLIDKKGMDEVVCYKKANVSRKTFSKINTEKSYRPSKPTVAGFAISLELNLEETQSLMKTAGYSLSHTDKFDLIVEFFIVNEIYNIHEVNAALYKYDLPCIGC